VSVVVHAALLLALTTWEPPHRKTFGESGIGAGGNSIVDVGLISSPTGALDSPSPDPEPPRPKPPRKSRSAVVTPKVPREQESESASASESESDKPNPDSGKEESARRKPLVARGDGASAPTGSGAGTGSGGTSEGQPGEYDDRIRGTMIVKCVLNRAGSLESCRVIKPLPRVSDSVMEALHKWHLSPLLLEDQDPTVDYVIPIKLVFPNR
jgi:protein TonB